MGVHSITPVSDNGLTVAQRILAALRDKLVAMQDQGAPVFREVLFGDLEDYDNTTLPIAGIDTGDEDMLPEIGGCSTYNWPIFFHFRFRIIRGVDELNVYRYYLGLIQKAVLEDHNLGGLTLDIEELNNSHTIIGVEGVYPGGTLSTMVKYRTRLHDPYRLLRE